MAVVVGRDNCRGVLGDARNEYFQGPRLTTAGECYVIALEGPTKRLEVLKVSNCSRWNVARVMYNALSVAGV